METTAANSVLIRQATVLDDTSSFHATTVDIQIVDGKIAAIANSIKPHKDTHLIDADRLWVAPALVDLYAQDACATKTHAMLYLPEGTAQLSDLRQSFMTTHNYYGNIHQLNQFPADFAKRYSGLSNCHTPFSDTRSLLHCMRYATSVNMPMVLQAMEPSMSSGDLLAHPLTWRKGHRLVDVDFELFDLERLLLLQKKSGCRLHISQVATKKAVDCIAQAQQAGCKITADVAVANLLYCLDDITDINTFAKVWPPLGSASDKQALLAGLRTGVLSAMVSNHSAVTRVQKDTVIEQAPFGAYILPFMLQLLAYIAQTHSMDFVRLLSQHGSAAAKLFGITHGIEIGQTASCILFARPQVNTPLNLPLADYLTTDLVRVRIEGTQYVRYD